MEASFPPILCLSPKKKKVLRLSFATFLRDFCNIQERGAVNSGCLWFLAGNKNAGFWRKKKRRNLQNFIAKMPEKISHFSHFFALIGNTGYIIHAEIEKHLFIYNLIINGAVQTFIPDQALHCPSNSITWLLAVTCGKEYPISS